MWFYHLVQMEKGSVSGPSAPSVPVTTSSASCAAIQLPALEALFHTMTSVLRMPGVINNRMVLDPLAKLLSYSLQVYQIPRILETKKRMNGNF